MFPLFDCRASGRQPELFGQRSLEFQTGGIGHGGRFLGRHIDMVGAPFLVWHADMIGAPFLDWHGQTFRPAYLCPIESTGSLSNCFTSSNIGDTTQ